MAQRLSSAREALRSLELFGLGLTVREALKELVRAWNDPTKIRHAGLLDDCLEYVGFRVGIQEGEMAGEYYPVLRVRWPELLLDVYRGTRNDRS